MNVLLAYLIQCLQTVDGRKNSAKFIIEASVKIEVEKRENELNRDIIRKREKYI